MDGTTATLAKKRSVSRSIFKSVEFARIADCFRWIQISFLEQLPPELLTVIFDQVGRSSHAQWNPSKALLGRILLPFIQKNFYAKVHLDSYSALRILAHTVVSAPDLGHHIKALTIQQKSIEQDIDFVQIPLQILFDFFLSSPKLTVLAIHDAHHLLYRLLTPKFAFHALNALVELSFTNVPLPSQHSKKDITRLFRPLLCSGSRIVKLDANFTEAVAMAKIGKDGAGDEEVVTGVQYELDEDADDLEHEQESSEMAFGVNATDNWIGDVDHLRIEADFSFVRLKDFGSLFPVLTSLTLVDTSTTDVTDFERFLSTINPAQITSLNLESHWWAAENELDINWSQYEELQELTINGCGILSYDLFENLHKLEELTSIEIGPGANPEYDDLVSILHPDYEKYPDAFLLLTSLKLNHLPLERGTTYNDSIDRYESDYPEPTFDRDGEMVPHEDWNLDWLSLSLEEAESLVRLAGKTVDLGAKFRDAIRIQAEYEMEIVAVGDYEYKMQKFASREMRYQKQRRRNYRW